ncbi:hypothetical protein [Mucilaginibacter paludis]|uniref:Uncharacterized protein n=1 Tax=Mucilaginibacter paludis DSM 18603 TaxID=714943 RepID=H1Y2C6_9SPHI|nr:hypothetical protein [Mucilaginibacter paludis]EHQ27906.1 hypothetical protein Mucpa_3810 [Mucilaginibacter paludis DSM 18603]
MNPQYRKPLILFVASFIPVVAGMACKVMHWLPVSAGGTLFGAGMLVQLFSILWLIAVILKPRKKNQV